MSWNIDEGQKIPLGHGVGDLLQRGTPSLSSPGMHCVPDKVVPMEKTPRMVAVHSPRCDTRER